MVHSSLQSEVWPHETVPSLCLCNLHLLLLQADSSDDPNWFQYENLISIPARRFGDEFFLCGSSSKLFWSQLLKLESATFGLQKRSCFAVLKLLTSCRVTLKSCTAKRLTWVKKSHGRWEIELIECLWCAHFVLEALQLRQFPMRSLWNCNDLRSSGRLLEICLRRSVGRCWLQKLPNKIVKDVRNSHTLVLCADCIWAPCASKAGGLEWIAGFWRLGKTRWWRSCWKETPLYNSMLFHYVSTPELQVLSNKEIKQISGWKSNLSCFSSAFPLGRLQVKRPWHWLAWDSQARVVAT